MVYLHNYKLAKVTLSKIKTIQVIAIKNNNYKHQLQWPFKYFINQHRFLLQHQWSKTATYSWWNFSLLSPKISFSCCVFLSAYILFRLQSLCFRYFFLVDLFLKLKPSEWIGNFITFSLGRSAILICYLSRRKYK